MILDKLAPLFVIFAAAFVLKRVRVVEKHEAKFLGKMLLNFFIPLVIAGALSKAQIDLKYWKLPVVAVIFIGVIFAISYFSAKLLFKNRKDCGSYFLMFCAQEGGLVGFVFLLAVWGSEALSRFVLFDFVHLFYVLTIVYVMAAWYGGKTIEHRVLATRFLMSPLLWGAIVGIALNALSVQNGTIDALFKLGGDGSIVLIMIVLGLEFEPSISALKKPFMTAMAKISIGMSFGFLLVYLFGLTGLDRIVVLVATSLPPSFLMFIYGQENGLDEDYMANTLSIGIPLGFIALTLLTLAIGI